MPILTGALTALTLAGTPGLPAWTDTTPPSAKAAGPFTRLIPGGTAGRLYGTFAKSPTAATGRTYSTDFTRLALLGTPSQVYGTFAGKAEKTEDFKYVTDTIITVVTEGPVSDVDLEVNEIFRPVVTETRGVVGLTRAVTDTIRPRVTEAVQFLEKSGTIAKVASDSIVPVVTEAVTKAVGISASDTIIPVITEGTSLTTSDAKFVTDTITLVLEETPLLNTSLAQRNFFVTDTITVNLLDSGRLADFGEVDNIRITSRPYGIIRITEA